MALNLYDLTRCGVTDSRLAGNSETDIMSLSGDKTRSTFQRYNIVDENAMEAANRRREAARKRRVEAE